MVEFAFSAERPSNETARFKMKKEKFKIVDKLFSQGNEAIVVCP